MALLVLLTSSSLPTKAKDTYLTISYNSNGGAVACLQVDFFEDGSARMTSYNSEGMPSKVVSGTWTTSDHMTYMILTFVSNEGYRTSFEAIKSANGHPSMVKDGKGSGVEYLGCS